MTQPIENCYWVVPGKLLAGEYPRNKDEKSSREKIAALRDAGITAFIDLTEEDEGLLAYTDLLGDVSHQRFPIQDVSIPDSSQQTRATLDEIDRYISEGKSVYVHCWGGVGRTSVIVGCWLARHGYKGEVALIRLRELWQQCPKSARRQSPETKTQEQYILTWEES